MKRSVAAALAGVLLLVMWRVPPVAVVALLAAAGPFLAGPFLAGP